MVVIVTMCVGMKKMGVIYIVSMSQVVADGMVHLVVVVIFIVDIPAMEIAEHRLGVLKIVLV